MLVSVHFKGSLLFTKSAKILYIFLLLIITSCGKKKKIDLPKVNTISESSFRIHDFDNLKGVKYLYSMEKLKESIKLI